jgi:hypothetical protein
VTSSRMSLPSKTPITTQPSPRSARVEALRVKNPGHRDFWVIFW